MHTTRSMMVLAAQFNFLRYKGVVKIFKHSYSWTIVDFQMKTRLDTEPQQKLWPTLICVDDDVWSWESWASDHTRGTLLCFCIPETSFIKKFYSECDYPGARAGITLIWDLGHDLYQQPDSDENF